MAAIVTRGIIIGVSTLLSFIIVFRQSGSLELARTAALVTLVLNQLIHVFECKSEEKSIFRIPILSNLWLVAAVFISLAVLVAVIYIPALQSLFRTVALLAEQWIIVTLLSFLPPVISSFFKRRSKEG